MRECFSPSTTINKGGELLQFPTTATELLPAETYLTTFRCAQEVLQQQTGIARIPHDIPIYVAPDIQSRMKMVTNLLRVPFIEGKGKLCDALHNGEAAV